MTNQLNLSEKHRRKIETLLHEYLPDVEVWVYGSRVSGHSHDGSDLDLVLRGPGLKEIPIRQLADFEEAIQESTIPFLVEARDWARLPDRFHREIENNYVELSTTVKSACTFRNSTYGRVSTNFMESPLKSLCSEKDGIQTGPFGSQLHKKDYVTAGTPIVTVEHIVDNRILHDHNIPQVSAHDKQRLSKYTLRSGDIIFSRVGSVDRRALVRNTEEGWLFSGRCLRVRPDPNKINPAYLSYFLGLPSFQEHIRSIAVGATMPSLNTQLLSDVMVTYPPNPTEQRSIAHILGTLDDKIELNRRMNETLEAIGQAIFKDWFMDFGPTKAKVEGRDPYLSSEFWDLFPDKLNDEDKPVKWLTQQANNLFEFNPRETVKKGTHAPYLDMAALPTNGLVPEPPLIREYKSGSKFRDGDTLLARITPCLENGKTAYVFGLGDTVIGTGSTEFIVIRSRNPLPQLASYLLARTPEFRAHVERSMTGTSGRQRASAESANGYEITTPSNGELWEALGILIQPIVARIISNAQESQSLAQARDFLLPKLMSGEIRIRDAEKIAESAVS